MKIIPLLAVLLTARPVSAAPAATAPAAVPTPKRPVVDAYHGVKVSEDYRWLEDGDSPEVKEWSRAQNARTRAALDAIPARAALREKIKAYYAKVSPSYFGLAYRRGRYFLLKLQPPKNQPLLVTLSSPDDLASEKTVCDPNELNKAGLLAIDWFVPSLDGKRVAVALSEKGSEDASLHFFDAETGAALPDVVPRVNYPTAGGSAAWNSDGTGVWYTRYPQGAERPKEDANFYQQVWFHRLGTPASADTYAIGKDFPRIAEIMLETRGEGRHLLASVSNGDGGEYAHYLMGPKGKWTQLTRFEDKVVFAALGEDDALYMISRKDAPRGKILRLAADDLRLSAAKTIVPETDSVLAREVGLVPMQSRLYALRLAGGPNEVSVYDLSGKPLGGVPLAPVSSVQEVAPVEGDAVLYRSQTYIQPSAWFRYAGSGEPAATALKVTAPVSYDDAEVVRETAVSKDGTKIPLSVIRRKGVKLDGKNPVLLYAYGGYGVSMSPRFQGIDGRLWLDAGGVYAVANIRGGGEFGEEWHRQGNLERKQNVFDDFAAAAEHLIKTGYTTPARLAIEGGSNGGLLMGAMTVQRPELFRAVISHVGIYDMLRVELDPNGSFNVTEFGSVKDPAQFKALLAYSPYHNVKDGAAYPAVLLMTGEHDGRVNPLNSRKMAARLQAATSSGKPVLLRVSLDSGHGMGTALNETIEQKADAQAFLADQLGLGRGR